MFLSQALAGISPPTAVETALPTTPLVVLRDEQLHSATGFGGSTAYGNRSIMTNLRQDRLSLISVVGMSHHTCPVEVRERFTLPVLRAPESGSGDEREDESESGWLGTCNRTELYSVFGDAGDPEAVFTQTLSIPAGLAARYTYVKTGIDAVSPPVLHFRRAGVSDRGGDGTGGGAVPEEDESSRPGRVEQDTRSRGRPGPIPSNGRRGPSLWPDTMR